MGKVRRAKIVLGTAKTIGWLLLAGLAGLVLWWLWGWAVGHFLSFAIVFGIIGAIGGIFGVVHLLDWAISVIRDEQDEEKLIEYRKEHGEHATPPKNKDTGRYRFDRAPVRGGAYDY